MTLFEKVKSVLQRLRFLFNTNAPFWVIKTYVVLRLSQVLSNRFDATGKKYLKKRDAFRGVASSLRLDNDWFITNIPLWLRAFDITRLSKKERIECLEVGSWQGLSAFFTLYELPQATLTCVDTWEGADEHKTGAEATGNVLSNIEKTFDQNLSAFNGRLTKYKGTSFSYYVAHKGEEAFDLIYIDGSHHTDDVIVDAIKCFEMLKVGGIMIFDDYFWKYYTRDIDNPAGAINAFLRLKRHQLEIICFDWQLIVKKTARTERHPQT